ncbi:hypothetical protein CTI12_AA279400 [Artemisia annua]|uniref:Uncharacterized protein n=1 Tax=Artemisia annua TaxID=35608 RepID=A0A2U1MWJ8_ARTAN|nr:hypothetical protein CTI12_AA279400 [Artemisia annua]
MAQHEYTVDQYIIKTVGRLGIEGAAFELELYESDVRNIASGFVDYLQSFKGRSRVSENLEFLDRMIQDADEKHQESLSLLHQKIQDLNLKHQERVGSLCRMIQESNADHQQEDIHQDTYENFVRLVEKFAIPEVASRTGLPESDVWKKLSVFIEYLKSAGGRNRVPQYVGLLKRLITERNLTHQRYLQQMQNQARHPQYARVVKMMVQDSKANHKTYIETLQKMIQDANMERGGSRPTEGMLANHNQASSNLMVSNGGSTRGGVTMGTGAGPSSGGMTTATNAPPIMGIPQHKWPALIRSDQKKKK